MAKYAWLTGDSPAPDTFRGRCFSVPDDIALVSAVTGALVPLIYPENWEQAGSMTAAEAAEIMGTAFDAFVAGECGSGECPPPQVDTPDGPQPIYRRNPTTDRWEIMQPDLTWTEPTGDEEIPDPTARGEGTATDRTCAAATNAANRVKQIYDEVLADINADVDTAQLAVTLAASAALYAGAWVYPPALATIAIDFAAFEGFAEAGQAIVLSNLWTDHFTQKYICCLKDNATDTAGVVTFDRLGVNRCLLESIWADQQYVLLVTMVIYIHAVIGEQGLNLLGTDTTLAGNCSHCGEWARQFNFAQGPAGWFPTISESAWSAGGYWLATSGSGRTIIDFRIDTNGAAGSFTITKVRIKGNIPTGALPSGVDNRMNWNNSGTYYVEPTVAVGNWTYTSGALSWPGTTGQRLKLRQYNGSTVQPWKIFEIIVWGTGTMPWADIQGVPYYGE